MLGNTINLSILLLVIELTVSARKMGFSHAVKKS
jgi:hypothetical protein